MTLPTEVVRAGGRTAERPIAKHFSASRSLNIFVLWLLLFLILTSAGCGRKRDIPVEITGKVAQLYPTAFNNQGAIVGSIRFPDLYPSFFIAQGKQQELPLLTTPEKASYVYPQAINDAGQIVGYASRTRDATRHAVLWQNGRALWLEDGNAVSSEATAVNAAGVIVGFRIGTDGVAHAVQWRNGAIQELASSTSISWRPVSINAKEDVVGCGMDAQSRPHLYLWRQNRLSEVGIGYHIAINNRGLTAGEFLASDRHVYACQWENSRHRKELPNLPGTNDSRVYAVNDRGDIVGSADFRGPQPEANGTPIPLLWRQGRVLDLNTVRPPNAAYTLEEAVGINNRGQILCTARQGKWGRTALLTPTENGWQIQIY